MLSIGREDILARMGEDNPWWRREPDPSEPPLSWRRRAFYDAFRNLVLGPVRRAVVLLGARRVGKTTLLMQFIGECVRDRRFPEVLFASLDTPTYADLSLDELLRLFAEARPHDPTASRLVVFDEVQYLRDWERHLKVLVDRFPHTRFVVSGSAGAALQRASTESGAGRFTDFLLPPLTFAEFLTFRDEAVVREEADRQPPMFACPDIARLNRCFVEYLNYGGYPEAILVDEVRAGFRQFVGRDIVDKVLLRDLPVLYGISNIPGLNRLFSVLAYNTGQEVSLEDLASNAGVAKPTIKRYLEYLETAFLVYRLRRVDANARRFRRERGFKVHLVNPSMRAALFAPTTPEDARFGTVVESAVLAQFLHLPDRSQIHYARWRDGEVDILRLEPASQRPSWAVEVKWTDRAVSRRGELAALAEFAARYPGLVLGVTTKGHCRRGRLPTRHAVTFVPAALYTYALGALSARRDNSAQRRVLKEGALDCTFRLGE